MKTIAVFLKEFVDLFRDRRALYSGFAYALLGPALAIVAVNSLAAQSRSPEQIQIAYCGRHAFVELAEHLESRGFAFQNSAKLCIDAPADSSSRLAEGKVIRIGVVGDLVTSASEARKLEQEIRRFSQSVELQRTLARGLLPSVFTPLEIDTKNSSSVSRQSDAVARMLIVFFVCAPFFVSAAACADLTAGERERHSLEPLLVHPIGRHNVILGKWLAVVCVSAIGVVGCVVGGLAMLSLSALPELGIRLETSFSAGVMASVLLLPLTGLVAAVQLTIGLWSKSFKDAQSYLMLLSFVPIVPGFLLSGEEATKWSFLPLIWELNAIAGPLLGRVSSGPSFLLMFLVEAALIVIVLAVAAGRLRSEKVLSL